MKSTGAISFSFSFGGEEEPKKEDPPRKISNAFDSHLPQKASIFAAAVAEEE